MSRIADLPPEAWHPDLRAAIDAKTLMPLQRRAVGVLAHAPHMVKANGAFMATATRGQTLPHRLVELVRLRIAFHNQCRTCMAMRHQSAIEDGLTEGMVCSLERPAEAADLSEREKAAVDYADLLATNHFAINEQTFARLRQHFSDGEIIELGLLTGYFIGFGRFLATLDIVEDLPRYYQDKSDKVAPWQAPESVVVKL